MPFKEDTCREIARIGNGVFFRASDTKTMTEIFDQIDHLEKTDVQVQKASELPGSFHLALGSRSLLAGSHFRLGRDDLE